MREAEQAVGEVVGYGVPFVVFVASGLIALWGYYRTRAWWMERLDSSRGGRFVFFITANFVVMLFLGALCDKVDITEVFDGAITAPQTALLSVTAAFLTLFFYLQGCWFHREELLTIAATKSTARFVELECQRNFLAGIQNHLNEFIGKYRDFVVRYLKKGDEL
jgi:hypothetical protein